MGEQGNFSATATLKIKEELASKELIKNQVLVEEIYKTIPV